MDTLVPSPSSPGAGRTPLLPTVDSSPLLVDLPEPLCLLRNSIIKPCSCSSTEISCISVEILTMTSRRHGKSDLFKVSCGPANGIREVAQLDG